MLKLQDLKYFRFFDVTLNDKTMYIITNNHFNINDYKKICLKQDNDQRLNTFDYFFNRTREEPVVLEIEKDMYGNPYFYNFYFQFDKSNKLNFKDETFKWNLFYNLSKVFEIEDEQHVNILFNKFAKLLQINLIDKDLKEYSLIEEYNIKSYKTNEYILNEFKKIINIFDDIQVNLYYNSENQLLKYSLLNDFLKKYKNINEEFLSLLKQFNVE
jgi:hypothetical protein